MNISMNISLAFARVARCFFYCCNQRKHLLLRLPSPLPPEKQGEVFVPLEVAVVSHFEGTIRAFWVEKWGRISADSVRVRLIQDVDKAACLVY